MGIVYVSINSRAKPFTNPTTITSVNLNNVACVNGSMANMFEGCRNLTSVE